MKIRCTSAAVIGARRGAPESESPVPPKMLPENTTARFPPIPMQMDGRSLLAWQSPLGLDRGTPRGVVLGVKIQNQS